MKRNNINSFLFILLLFISCDQENNNKLFNQIITLSIGESIYIQEREFLIEFVTVLDDSRCPTGAICVWEGNGRIEIFTTKPETDSTYFELNTTLDPKIIEYSGCNIELIELNPYPSIEEIIDSTEYVSTLQIREF